MPRQMLAAQTYDDHNSIHDNATAQKYGFKGGTIEGPTHFSQFAPLCVALWGPQWLAQGSLSAHYRNACFEGDKVRALVTKPVRWRYADDHPHGARRRHRDSARHGRNQGQQSAFGAGAADQRAESARNVGDPARRACRHAHETHRCAHGRGPEYGSALSVLARAEAAADHGAFAMVHSRGRSEFAPWKEPIIPLEMVSVLLNYSSDAAGFPVRKPVVGLFADQEIRMHSGTAVRRSPVRDGS